MRLKAFKTKEPKTVMTTEVLIKRSILISLGIHILVVGLGPWLFSSSSEPMVFEDSGIEISVESFMEMDSGQQTLPNAQEAPEQEVPDNILPQLPKSVTVAEEEKPPQDNPDGANLVEEQDPKEKKKDESNKITKKELQKRQAIERLRKLQDKKSKSYKAPNVDELASLKKALEKYNRIGNLPAGSGSPTEFARCKVEFDRLVRQNYQLPKAYTLKELTVSFDVTFTRNGRISKAEVRQSSGDQLFDKLTLEGLRAAVPLPNSCKGLEGQAVRLSFKS